MSDLPENDPGDGSRDPRDHAQAEAQLRAAFRLRLPGAPKRIIDVLVSAAKQAPGWTLDASGAADATLETPGGLIVVRQFLGAPPVKDGEHENPLPATPAAPPAGLTPAERMSWARGHLNPTPTVKTSPEMPPDEMTGAERISWWRARRAAERAAE